MRKREIQSLRKTLVQRMEDLRSTTADAISKMKNADDRYADHFDLASIESCIYSELSCRTRERQMILNIKETIRRMDQGLFGICEQCGQPISKKRLLLAPLSRLCVPCQEVMETNMGRHKQRAYPSYMH